MRRRSYTWPDLKDTTGSWGGSPEIVQKNIIDSESANLLVVVWAGRRACCRLFAYVLERLVHHVKQTEIGLEYYRFPQSVYPRWNSQAGRQRRFGGCKLVISPFYPFESAEIS
jgi:hypothetical protein